MLSFHVKFVQTDRQTDGQTTLKQYAPDLWIRGHKKENVRYQRLFLFSVQSFKLKELCGN